MEQSTDNTEGINLPIQAGPQTTTAKPSSEYEREPVPKSALLGFKSFIGMYAGEHCAGTEMMIGPLFVAAGVGAFDLIVGLLVGNALAVLSWMLFCAPIATRARLTLYYQLERIGGSKFVIFYNLANGVMFCFLAGAMVTVSATALGVWFDFKMPGLNDIYPNSIGWVVAVSIIGLLIAIVAAYGYEIVARVANIAAPWMVLIFLAFGIVGLKNFIHFTDYKIESLGDLWTFADTRIWKGGDPLPGQVKFTFWHVTFFAWFCNMAMHIGMSDLSVLRYAKKSWYAIASGAGMYLGHFMAWISASILFAYQLERYPSNTDVLPGPMANEALGLAGLICVIIAGWTTANPTIYRAGLAFQAIAPKRSRFAITFMTGIAATIAGMFPAIAMKLLGFVALYGLLLMPIGAIIFVDFWLLKKIGLQSNYAYLKKQNLNWSVAITWIGTLTVCLWLVSRGSVQIYFISLPGWFMAAISYIVISYIYQRNIHASESLKKFISIISLLIIAAIAILIIGYFTDRVEDYHIKPWIWGLTIAWFITAGFWIR